jgi:predicted dienelactone hydrolase
MSLVRFLITVALALLSAVAQAAVGVTEIPGKDGDGPVTIFYPSSTEEKAVTRGPFKLKLAQDGVPVRGNGRLVVLSHGSGGNPWVHSDLARTLVEAGFVAAMPEHQGDNYKDHSKVGPESWKLRPAEVSRAIDVVARDARFGSLLKLDKVGMYGMSAGGHTALTLAGGRWSPKLLKEHCEQYLSEDFYSCVGLAVHLTGGWMDGPKKTLASWVIRATIRDTNWYAFTDPRITAVVAGVPYSIDFDPASLAEPRVPLALVTAKHDIWLIPRFHSDAVLKTCAKCERLADIDGGHGALLSPPIPALPGLIGELLNDPPGFDRGQLPAVDHKIAAFFREHLLP